MQKPTSQGGYGLLWKADLLILNMNLIDNDIWMHMLEDRNELAHDYDGTLAEECAERIVNQYIPIFEEFREKARGYIEELQSKG